MPKYKLNLVKDDYSKFIYSIDVNNLVEYFCESAPNVSDRQSFALVTKTSVKGKLKIRNYFQGWGMGAITSILGGVKL